MKVSPYVPITLSPPAVRLIVVTAHRDGGGDEGAYIEFIPVVGLAAWRDDEGLNVEPIVCCPDGAWASVGTVAQVLDGFCESYRLVPCPWPEPEDAVRLKPHADALRAILAGPPSRRAAGASSTA